MAKEVRWVGLIDRRLRAAGAGGWRHLGIGQA